MTAVRETPFEQGRHELEEGLMLSPGSHRMIEPSAGSVTTQNIAEHQFLNEDQTQDENDR